MLKVDINHSHTIDVTEKGKVLLIDGLPSAYELIPNNRGNVFTIIKESKIYNIDILSVEDKKATVSINNHPYVIEVADHIDQMLEKLGMDTAEIHQIKEVKAPMPGSILKLLVKEGESVQAGDPILVLEAMKMENVLKSVGEGVVSKIHIAEKQNVEKNQVLITFD